MHLGLSLTIASATATGPEMFSAVRVGEDFTELRKIEIVSIVSTWKMTGFYCSSEPGLHEVFVNVIPSKSNITQLSRHYITLFALAATYLQPDT